MLTYIVNIEEVDGQTVTRMDRNGHGVEPTENEKVMGSLVQIAVSAALDFAAHRQELAVRAPEEAAAPVDVKELEAHFQRRMRAPGESQ
jgi:hypothetical protein